jgi:hypothetical protein
MSASHIFLKIRKEFRDLPSYAITFIVLQMAGFILFDVPSLFIFLLFCHILLIYVASYDHWTAARFRRYLKYVFKICFVGSIVYILICLPFAYRVFNAPDSVFNKHLQGIKECAFRLEENRCTSKNNNFIGRVRGVERECFALAMCLRQPLFLLQTYGFVRELLAQIFSQRSFHIFVVWTGCYVAWGLSRGQWMHGANLIASRTSTSHVCDASCTSTKGEAAQISGYSRPDSDQPVSIQGSTPLVEVSGHETALDTPNLDALNENQGTPFLGRNGSSGASRRRRSHLFRVHEDPLRQHPDILTPGAPASRPSVAPPQEHGDCGPQTPHHRLRELVDPFLDHSDPTLHHVGQSNNSPESHSSGVGGQHADLGEGLVELPLEEVVIMIPLPESSLRGEGMFGETTIEEDHEIVEIPIPDGTGNCRDGNEQSLFDAERVTLGV